MGNSKEHHKKKANKMKKILVSLLYGDIVNLEYAIENIEKGNEVFILQCDRTMGICTRNVNGVGLLCSLCQCGLKSVLNEMKLVNKAKLLRLSKMVAKDDIKESQSFNSDFNSVQELKNLTYKGAQVGYGAFSSYVTSSRNVMPDMTTEFKKYIQFLIRKEIIIYNVIERLHKEYNFDQIVLHNGRFAHTKPFLEFARNHKVDFVVTEFKIVNDQFLKDVFYNDIPHSISYLAKNVKENWEKGDPTNREEIGRSFFERKKMGMAAGDKVYTKNQHAGELPEGWNELVENITIFNSSEDEFCSVSKEYDNNILFSNQFVALKTIFEHYKGDKTKHFYLRIHPNLDSVPYRSHMALYELKYDNVTIISPTSTISSYTLLDKSDKIIIFNSTMGVEATYWGKPVISLTKYIYWELGLLHHPETNEQLWEMIDDKELKVITNDNLIKYSYWLLHPNYPIANRIPVGKPYFKLIGNHMGNVTIMKLFGSYNLFFLLYKLFSRINLFPKFKGLPCTEPYIISK